MNKNLSYPAGMAFVLLASILWGTSGTLQAFAPPERSPLVFGVIRILLGGLFLSSYVMMREGVRAFKGRWLWRGVCISALGIMGLQFCFFSAVLRTGVAVGTMVTIGSSPIMAGMMEHFILKKELSHRWKIATFLAVTGCILLSLGIGSIEVDLFGITLALFGGFFYSLFGFGMKQIEGTHSPLATVSIVMLTAFLLGSPVLLFMPLEWLMSTRGVLTSLSVGFLATSLPYALFSKGLIVVPLSTAYTLGLGEPLTATVLGIALLGERLSLFSSIGAVLIFSGILVLSCRINPPKKEQVRKCNSRERGTI